MTELIETKPGQMVAEFQEAFDAKNKDLYFKLCMEEANEVLEAAEHLVKECADLVYVATGYENVGGMIEFLATNPEINTAFKWVESLIDMIGQDRTAEAFKRVHESNMSKLGEDGKPVRREDGKVLKGPNYKPPVLSDLVR